MKKGLLLSMSNLLKSASLLLLLLSSLQNANGQSASSYSFAASSGTLTYLSGGTTVSSLVADDGTATIPIGFTFIYCGTGYTSMKACSNGWLSFNSSTTSNTWTNSLANVSTLKPVLMPWFDDMTGYGTGSQVSYLTTGTAGSRVFTIEYKNWDCDYSYNNNLTFQVKLYEANGAVQYIYKQESGYFYGQSASVGIGDGASTPTYLSLNGSGSSPTASSSSFTTSISSRPANGQIYQFTPPQCSGSPTAGTATISSSMICAGNSITLNVPSASTGFGITFQWQQSATGTGGWSNITGATTASYSMVPTVASYYRCLVSCTLSGLANYSTTVSVGFNYNIATTTPATRCGTGTVSLAATGTSGAAIKWYTAATGGSSIGSGSPITSPIISSTTDFYVSAESTSSGTGISPTGTTSTSSSTAITPFSLYWTSAHTQYIVEASDLTAAGFVAGNLTGLSFNVTTKSSSKPYNNYTIKLAHTTATSLSGLLSPTFTTVYGPTSYSSVSGANNFSFGTSFSWDGTSNILLDVCFDNVTPGSGYSSSDAVTMVSKSPTVVTYGMYEDYYNMCGVTSGGYTTSSSLIPQINFTGPKVCASPRVAVTATVNTAPAFGITGSQTVCNNNVATMSVSSTLSSYNTYTWSPATGLFTDAACTTAYTTGTSASTVYAKTATAGTIKYFCTANNTSSLCSGLDSASVTTLPSSVTAIATPTYICGSGNTTLTLSPSASGFGTAQYQWQTSPNNSTWSDSSGSTTSSLTTNTLTSTRYYRVVLKNSAGTTCLNSTSDTGLVYSPTVASVTNGQRCSSGTVTLGATATDGSIDWYSSPSGGTSLSSGTSFTTPTIYSTTTYYAEAVAVADKNFSIGSAGTTLSSTAETPFSQYYESQHTQYLVMASDLSSSGMTAGLLNTLSFNVSGKYSSLAYGGYTVKMAHTSATSLSSGLISPTFTTVYGPTSYTSVSGANLLSFSTPFYWNGTSNIVVDVCFASDPTGGTGTFWTDDDYVKGTTKSYTATYGYYQDNTNLCGTTSFSSTSSNNLPDMVFSRFGCKSARSAVVATVNPLPTPTISPATGPIQICAGSSTTLTGGGGGTYQWRDTTGPITGATSSTFSTGTTGSYRVIVTTPATGCKDSSAVVAVNVNPVPTVSIKPVGTTQICEDSSQLLTSVVTGLGLTYQWFNSGTIITGATTDSLRRNTSGVYSLRVYLGLCSDTSNDATLIVNPLPAASFTKTGTTGAICLGSTLELTALTVPTGSSYQWFLNGVPIGGATSKIYNAPTGGIYSVQIRDANNCRKVSDTMNIINTPMGIPNLSPSEARFCEGTELKLYANAGPFASKFQWTRNGTTLPDTTENIVSGTDGVYDVTVTDVYGCVLTSPQSTLTIDALPVKPVINKSGAIMTTANPYTTYQWFRNGKAIAGAIYRSYTLMFDGDYHVLVTNTAGCFNVSDTLSIQNLAVKALVREELDIKVYPNPSQDKVMIDAPIEVNLMIKDMQGKQILQVNNAKQVDMSVYADGVYFFTLTDKEGMVVKMDKIVKRTN